MSLGNCDIKIGLPGKECELPQKVYLWHFDLVILNYLQIYMYILSQFYLSLYIIFTVIQQVMKHDMINLTKLVT